MFKLVAFIFVFLFSLFLTGCVGYKMNIEKEEVSEKRKTADFNAVELIIAEYVRGSISRIENASVISFTSTDGFALSVLNETMMNAFDDRCSGYRMLPSSYPTIFYSSFNGIKRMIALDGLQEVIPSPKGLNLSSGHEISPIEFKSRSNQHGWLCGVYDDTKTVAGGHLISFKKYFVLYQEYDSDSGRWTDEFQLVSYDEVYLNELLRAPYLEQYNAITEEEVTQERAAIQREQERFQKKVADYKANLANGTDSFDSVLSGTQVCVTGKMLYTACLNPQWASSCTQVNSTGTLVGYASNSLENGNIEIRMQELANISKDDLNKFMIGNVQKGSVIINGVRFNQGHITAVPKHKLRTCVLLP